MEIFQSIINYILDLGSAIFVPLIILLLGLIAGMAFKKAFKSAITLGCLYRNEHGDWFYVGSSWSRLRSTS